ncbi:MAG: type IV pilus modification PilV family protein [Bdellovibrionia bacterium]
MLLKFLSADFKSKEGFTLLEVMIALAIMALGFGAILATEGASIQASTRAKEMNTVAMLARNQMVETEIKLEGKRFEEVKKEERGTFKEPFSDYSWTRVIKEVKLPNLGNLLSSQPSSSSNSQNFAGSDQAKGDSTQQVFSMLSKYLEKALREITITISWSRGGKPQSFSLSTYWVNLNHEMQLTN